ncbi:hypothetical protein JCM1840_004254 [Sporobolomyces johnsonii]
MVATPRSVSKVPSPTTHLVQQLQAFGKDDVPQHDPDLDEEDEELTVNRTKASTAPSAPQKDAPPTQQLGKLSLKAPAPAKPAKKPPKSLRNLLRSTEHTVTLEGEDGTHAKHVLTSWKMADYAYKREPCPFPTRARGLFTEKVKDGDDEEYRIVARGYDKFFNVDEVSWTKWDKIHEYSTGPYELTTKSNGCIILIAALTPQHIVVTSKHSIGRNANLSTEGGVSHSERGEYWLEKHVEKVGKKKEDLAKELYERNLTAVAELCDDSFEEHVLAYPSHLTGLHLHGLNVNAPILNTLPSSEVASFAKSWGMIPTPYTVFPSIPAVKTYCANVEAAGGVEGPDGKLNPVEGFVVRGHRKGGAPGEAFFWKVKYDEPYLMYREWRELTRKLLAAYPDLDGVKPNRLRNEESRLYLWWVAREIKRDHAKFEPWKHGKGIIATREEFLRWTKTPEAKKARKDLGQQEKVDEEERKNMKFDKTLIVPVAVQGCGKTALGLELSHLFGWGHVQSDDFLVKKPAPHFLKAVKDLLNQGDVVFADKNNHQIKHRSDLVSLADSLSPSSRVRLVALVWPIDSPTLPRDKFHALCASRIVHRGQNHQSLRAGEGHEQVIWQFLGQHEAFDPAVNAGDGRFDVVIEMKPEWERAEALERALDELAKIDGLIPTERLPVGKDKVHEALEFARTWAPKIKKAVTPTEEQQKKRKKAVEARYYGIAAAFDVHQLVEAHLPVRERDDPDSLWSALVKASRVERHPHVTLVHNHELKSEDEGVRRAKQALWDKYAGLVEAAAATAASGGGGATKDDDAAAAAARKLDVELVLGPRLVWDGRAMSIEVSALMTKVEVAEGDAPLIELVDGRSAHITVGTRSSDIRPVEGKFLMEAAQRGDKATKDGGEIHEVRIAEVRVPGKLAGLS